MSANISYLYPCTNACRSFTCLDGLWRMQFDSQNVGNAEHWEQGLPSPLSMPVPASFADLFTDATSRDYCGDYWYETTFYVGPYEESRMLLRFGSITHRATIYVNGVEAGSHEGGFTPVVLDVTELLHANDKNRVVVKANNELNEVSLPCGTVKTLSDGRKLAQPYFDFFNYAGIQRSVHLVQIPQESIVDYDTNVVLEADLARVRYKAHTTGTHEVIVELFDRSGKRVASATGKEGELIVEHPRLWEVRNAYLYTLVFLIVDGNRVIDKYPAKLGIRTVEVSDGSILLNGKPVYLKGYGKHEDFEVIGRAFNYAVAKRDFELMKWTNANCFRTSHYPYAEEWYQMADEEGFLIIDEVPAVGMMRSLVNFAAGAGGESTHFFQSDTVELLQQRHREALREMITRDKNHPCVIAFSIFNEPETNYPEARAYFEPLFTYARELDPQERPLTGALVFNCMPQSCTCYDLCDFVSLNRYYGWYVMGGPELCDADQLFRREMNDWAKVLGSKPLIFTEFGADTMASEHKLPSVMWSQEYQRAFYEMTFAVIDSYPFVQGELTWNFADFQTTEGTMRVNGNKKGVFTRNRQPKDVAYLLRDRWATK